MDTLSVGLLGFVALLFIIGIGVPVYIAMALVGFVWYWLISGQDAALTLIGMVPYSSVSLYTFTVMPMFILLGNFAVHAGFGRDIYKAAGKWFGRAPGGLAIGTIFGCASFGAASASSIATAITIGKMSIPEMQKYGYDPKLAAGSVAAGGPLASMIPPSVAMVYYGMLTDTSIGKLLIAGYLPGLMCATLLSLSVLIRCLIKPSLGPTITGITWKDRFVSLRGVWGIAIIALAIMGGIYTGFVTPTEAGAFGALVTLILGIASRRLGLREIWNSILDSAKTVCIIVCIVMGAFIFNYEFTITGAAQGAAAYISALPLPPIGILIAIMILYLVLGCFLDPAAMMFLTIPLVYPIIMSLGMDSIWFGILLVQNMEIGCITPPFGLTLFATKSIAPDLKTSDLIIAILPFLLALFLQLALLIIFPQIALFLPNTMKR